MSLFVPKEWKDRLAEFAGRRKLTNVSTGEETTVDVSRAEGEVSQAGDAFSAANMNDLEQRIKDGFDKVDTNLSNVSLPFINTKNVIYSAGGSFTWVATDNCYATGRLTTDNTNLISYFNIDGVEIGAMLKGSNVTGNMDYRCCIPVKKGQVVEVSNRSDLIMTFYGMG